MIAYTPLDTSLDTPLLAPATVPRRVLNTASRINTALTVSGMISTGILATLLTNNSFKAGAWPVGLVVTADVVSFLTAVIGKTAIVLFFNQEEFLKVFEAVWRRELPSFLNLRGKSVQALIGWVLNLVLSVNATLFWTGIAEISFEQSGLLLRQFNSASLQTMAYVISRPYFYIFFLIGAFYANIFAWPGIHLGIYHQMMSFIRACSRNHYYHTLIADIYGRINNTHREILKDIQNALKDPNQANYPRMRALSMSLGFELTDVANMSWLVRLAQNIKERDVHELRQVYIILNQTVYHPRPLLFSVFSRLIAAVITALSAYAYRNILGLSDTVWENWGLAGFSYYGARYCAYGSMVGVLSLSIYTMLCDLFDMPHYGLPLHIISSGALFFTFSMVFFVGICGGLANAEQSYIDGQSVLSIVLSDIASFLLDANAIYTISRNHAEKQIVQSESQEARDQLKQVFLILREKGNALLSLQGLTPEALNGLASAARENYESLENEAPVPDYFDSRFWNPASYFSRVRQGYGRFLGVEDREPRTGLVQH